jgi:hypothetical protein
MQTFLPYESFSASATVLDRQRLGKQRVENLQILKALLDPEYGWQNHPAVKMWRGYESALIEYQRAICAKWTNRGYRDSCLEKSLALGITGDVVLPPWLGNEQLHLSHRSNLLRKDPGFYGPKFENSLRQDVEYYWPTEEGYDRQQV